MRGSWSLGGRHTELVKKVFETNLEIIFESTLRVKNNPNEMNEDLEDSLEIRLRV